MGLDGASWCGAKHYFFTSGRENKSKTGCSKLEEDAGSISYIVAESCL